MDEALEASISGPGIRTARSSNGRIEVTTESTVQTVHRSWKGSTELRIGQREWDWCWCLPKVHRRPSFPDTIFLTRYKSQRWVLFKELRPDMTLCGWQDVNIQELTYSETPLTERGGGREKDRERGKYVHEERYFLEKTGVAYSRTVNKTLTVNCDYITLLWSSQQHQQNKNCEDHWHKKEGRRE